MYVLAPILSPCPRSWPSRSSLSAGVSIFGQTTMLQLTDFPVSVLFVLAIASIGIYGIVLAGWASGSTYPLLGGLRSTAQMISYEIAMGLSFVAVFLFAGSASSTSRSSMRRRNSGTCCSCCPRSSSYTTSMVGETNRAPFDLPEAEGELVGGFHTEYSSLKFAMFFLAEYINMVTVSALATTLFLGGWRAPVADLDLVGGQRGLVAHALVPHRRWFRSSSCSSGCAAPAPVALRPVHAVRLEGAHPHCSGLDRRGVGRHVTPSDPTGRRTCR